VYNPFSILIFFDKDQFHNFWFSSGTPSFLLQLIRNNKKDIRGMAAHEADMLVFDSYEIGNMHPISLLFQSGYLTIKEIRQQYDLTSYMLSYPNREVKDTFLNYILGDFTDQAAEKAGNRETHHSLSKSNILSN
jgi:hypothetical protein